MAWSTEEHYYSGQGIVLVAKRGTDGKPMGFRPVGNVSDLKVAIAVSTIEHKESTTGQRGIDLRLTTETKASLNFTLENFKAKNLADSLRGEATVVPGATVTSQAAKFYAGLIVALGKVQVSGVVVKQGATPLVVYVNDTTPWDYKLNTDAGSVLFNDGSAVAFSAAGETITAITVGATTSLAIASSPVAVGALLTPYGLTGADAAFLNGKAFTVLSNNGTAVVIAAVTTAKVITATGTPKAVYDGMAILLDYTYAAQFQIDALTQPSSELFMRFEGLNTAEGNSPVIVEVFRFLTDPLKELSLISDTVQQFVLEGSVLADVTRPTGSKYFLAQKLN